METQFTVFGGLGEIKVKKLRINKISKKAFFEK